jgi:hypothetical protein
MAKFLAILSTYMQQAGEEDSKTGVVIRNSTSVRHNLFVPDLCPKIDL